MLYAIPLSTFVIVRGFQLVRKLIGLNEGCDKPLRPADMLFYLWDGRLDVCVDLTGSSPLTQTRMVDFMPGRAMIDATQRKCVKYMAKCAAVGYGFISFSFSSLWKLKADAVTLLKRIQKFFIVQDTGGICCCILLFSVSNPCSTCSRVFVGDIYGHHDVPCAGIIGIKHRYIVVHDTLVDICHRSGISAGKEVDIGLGGGCDKPLRPTDLLLYSWGGGLDVCVNLTGYSPLTQTEMADFVPGHVMIDDAQRKRVKYIAKCGYWIWVSSLFFLFFGGIRG
ncbi:hypothetical protein Tco_0848010 [Tanacetum coccineum]